MTQNAIIIKVLKENSPGGELRFTNSFTIGRSKECDLMVREPSISRRHARIEFDGRQWWVKDLESGNGTFLNGARVQSAPLPDSAVIELGKGGPQLSLSVERKTEQAAVVTPPPDACAVGAVRVQPPPIENFSGKFQSPKQPEFSSETQIISRYFEKAESENAGEQTMMFRRAFDRAHTTKAKKYKYLIGVAILLLMVAGSVILYQKNKLEKMRATAQSIFYMMKNQELQISRLEEVVLLRADQTQMADLKAKRDKFKGMEKEYDSFVKELGIYAKLSEEDRVIMRLARIFGECEVAMPKGFAEEVKKYIGIWKSTDRLQTALNRAQQKGYTPFIVRILHENNLLPQYLFLALQESNFDDCAVGPLTRFGHAKGMWQFISQTADRYGLRIGPLYDKGVYDPQDDRCNFLKSTVAAVKYIKELNNSGAQASGLLVLASYNWGEGNVREIINKMPENPRERNFWRLLAMKNIPKETYDYVFMIFTAAVICEDPKLFGIDCNCPSFKTMNQPVKLTVGAAGHP